MISDTFPKDTTPEALRVQFSILRKMELKKRAEMAIKLSNNLRATLEAGVRMRHPEYDDKKVKLAAIRLSVGDELFFRAYPDVEVEP